MNKTMKNLHGKMRLGASAVVLAAIGLVGCQDLETNTGNDPNRVSALDDPTSLRILTEGNFQLIWDHIHGNFNTAWHPQNWGISMSSSNQTAGQDNFTLGDQFREEIENEIGAQTQTSIFEFWENSYEAQQGGLDVLNSTRNLNVAITDDAGVDVTIAMESLGEAWLGWTQGILGSIFDQAFIFDENSDLDAEIAALNLSPYDQVIDAALANFDDAIQLATNSFDLRSAVIFNSPNETIDNEAWAQFVRGLKTRYMILSARNPAERQAVDWTEVMNLVDNGITSPFEVQLNDEGFSSAAVHYSERSTGSTSWTGLNYRFIGRADVSGAFEAWMEEGRDGNEDREPIDLITPDRRITGATNDPGSTGLYIRNTTNNNFDDQFGRYRLSKYQHFRNRAFNGVTDFNAGAGQAQNGVIQIMRPEEMQLYKAEAYLRTGQPTLAAEIINVTREGNGQLPPVSATGVPISADCVPRDEFSNCEDLEGALFYERVIENFALWAQVNYYDTRGFGELVPGTFIHLPIPRRDIDLMGMMPYTFGGNAGGAAP